MKFRGQDHGLGCKTENFNFTMKQGNFFFCSRYGCFLDLLSKINQNEGGLEKFSRGYESFGIRRTPENGIYMKEWAPGAEGISLRGDFSKTILQL